ncbi:MAG: cytochrome c biogenesis protein ResB [Propionibacterium sp.]|nr:cytochrome c biogenesis protein ResB [Propionibacterium sp.]
MLKQGPQLQEPVDGLDTPVTVSPRKIFNKIYAFFYNKKVGLFLIFATGLLGLIGALTRQMSSAVLADPVAKAMWLDEMRPFYGGWTDIADFVGLFRIFSSPIFLTVTIALAVSIIACTTHRLPNIHRQAYRPRTNVRDSFLNHAKLSATVDSPLPREETLAKVREAIGKDRYRVIDDPSGETVYSDRFHWAPFGTAASHAGYVIIMAAFLVSSVAGFRNDTFDMTIGVPEEVGMGTGFVAEAVSFTDTYDEATGTPIDYVADLRVTDMAGEELARQEVRVNTPLILDGVYFHQASFGVSAMVHIQDDAGATLFDGGIPLVYTTPDDTRTYGVEVIDGVEIFAITNASGGATPGLGAGQVRFELYPEDTSEPIGAATVQPNQPATIGGFTLTFEREQKYTSMIVKKDPGAVVLWIGCAFLIVGMIVTMTLKHRRQWLKVDETEHGSRIRMATTDKPDSVRTRTFNDLAESISTAVGRESEGKADQT